MPKKQAKAYATKPHKSRQKISHLSKKSKVKKQINLEITELLGLRQRHIALAEAYVKLSKVVLAKLERKKRKPFIFRYSIKATHFSTSSKVYVNPSMVPEFLEVSVS